MKSLSQFVKYNNSDKLEENFSMITQTNYINLVSSAVTYHSKECFDILIKHPNKIKWINSFSNHYRISKIYENYYYAPNTSNEYYLIKVLEISEFINRNSLKFIIEHKNMFGFIFNRIVKDKKSINTLLYRICKEDNVDTFNIIHHYLIENNQEHPYYNDEFIKHYIFYYCLESGSIKIIEKLYSCGYDLSKIKFLNVNASSLVISIMFLLENNSSNYTQVFKYLVVCYPNIEQNLLWAYFLNSESGCNQPNKYLKLNFDWESNTDFTKLYAGNIDEFNNIMELTQDNFMIRIIDLINDLNDEDIGDFYYFFDRFIKIIQFLLEIKYEIPQIEEYFTAGTILNDTIYTKKNNLNNPRYKNLVISAIVNLAFRNENTSKPSWNGNEFKLPLYFLS